MNAQAKSSLSLIWPTTLAGLVGTAFLVAAVLAGPADADAPEAAASVNVKVQD